MQQNLLTLARQANAVNNGLRRVHSGVLRGGKPIPRIARPDPMTLAALVRAQEPFIVHDLYAGEGLDELRSLDGFITQLGDMRLTYAQEYTYNAFEAMRCELETKTMTVVDYLRFVMDHPATPLICVEGDLPQSIRMTFRLPSLFETIGDPDDQPRIRFFFGNPGNRSSLHFDADMRSGLLHQMFGEKTAVLVAPTASNKLLPVMNFSSWALQTMSEQESAGFAAFVDARVSRLVPGDTLFIPTAWWHYLGYDTFAASFSASTRRDPIPRLLGGRDLHWNHRSGAVAWRAASGVPTPADLALRLRSLLNSGLAPAQVFAEVEAVYLQTFLSMCADFPLPRTASPFALPERIYWEGRLQRGLLYAPATQQ